MFKAQSSAIFIIFLLIFVFALTLYLSNIFIAFLPSNTIAHKTASSIFNTIGSFFDNSIIIIFFVLLAIDIGYSAINPSKIMGIANIILLFAMVYVVLFLQNQIPLLNVLSANALLPNSMAFLSSSYLPYIIFIALIISIIMNFRKSENNGDSED